MKVPWRDASIAAAIATPALALYARTLTFEFVNVDDSFYVPGNEVVERGLTPDGFRYAFTSLSEGNYLPLTWLSHMLTVELWGTAPAAHHGVNAALHALTAALVFIFLRLATGATWRSAVVAALFAFHPLRVESVAWVAERKDVLSGAFWMFTLIAYWGYARRPSVLRYALVVAAFTLGLLSKSMVVTLPCVLFLLDLWPLNRLAPDGRLSAPRLARLALEKLPLLVLSAAAAAVALLGQRGVGAVNDIEAWSPSQRLLAAFSAYGAYLKATLWPANLAAFYPMPIEGVPLAGAVAVALVVIGITAAVLVAWKRLPYLATGWLWFAGSLVPVIGLVQVGAQSHADRYTYIPHIGLLIACVWAANDLMARRPMLARLRMPIAAALCAACAILSWRQIGHWRNSETLFRHALAVTDDNWFAEGNYAVALMNRGAHAQAEPHLRHAIEIGPPRHGDYLNLGFALLSMGRLDEAVPALETAAQLNPDHPLPWMLLGESRLGLGDAHGAIAAYEKGLALDPIDAKARVNLAVAHGMIGDFTAARSHFDRVLVRWPEHPAALYNLGAMEFRLGNRARAREILQLLVNSSPSRDDAWYALAALDALEANHESAAENLRRAIALNPELERGWQTDPMFDRLRESGVRP